MTLSYFIYNEEVKSIDFYGNLITVAKVNKYKNAFNIISEGMTFVEENCLYRK